MSPKIQKEGKKYIKLLRHILAELESYKGIINEERKKILTAKVIKYKSKIEQLKIHATRNIS